MIKLFVIDDSALVRSKIKEIFSNVEDIKIIGSAPNPVDAFEHFKAVGLPDVFILDIEMPKMDGLTFLQMIMTQKPTPVIICSTIVKNGTSFAIDAMRMGAVDIVLKPTTKIDSFFDEIKDEFIAKVRAAAKSKVHFINNIKRVSKSRKLSDFSVSSSVKATSVLPPSKKIVAIGSSTGGVQAVEEILRNLRANHPPIVITQHMPKGFTYSFAKRLDEILAYSNVKEAENGDVLMHGRVLIAPGGIHMEVKRDGVQVKAVLKDFAKVNSHKPSVNVLFNSMAKEVKSLGVGIILTGMGDDGAKGLLEMKKSGAKTYAQDKESCVVYGMPKKAVEMDAVDKVLNLKELAEIINSAR